MKKLIFTLALLVQVVCATATDKQVLTAQVRQENVQMYQQPGTSTKVIRNLSTADRLQIVRRYNNLWTIVTVDEEVGYVLHSELTRPATYQNLAAAKIKR